MNRSIYSYRVLSVAVIVIAALAGDAFATTTFVNTTSIAIPAPGISNGTSISVIGIGNSITSVSVDLKFFSDTDVGDLGLVLVGPTGAALSLMGNCGGSGEVSDLELTISDAATSLFPQDTTFASGSYKPTQYGSIGSFPSPGPGLAYNSSPTFGASSLSATFQDTNPNGNWSLYAIDPVSGDSGEISQGWDLQINAVPEPASLSLITVGAIALLSRRSRF
jgi:large repetitive protein